MDKRELEKYRAQLLDERLRLQADVTQMVDTALQPSDELSKTPIHIADLGSDASSQEIALSLMPNEERALEAINRALDQIELGSYGSCENCGQPIAKERLDAIPYASLCIRCAQSQEKTGSA